MVKLVQVAQAENLLCVWCKHIKSLTCRFSSNSSLLLPAIFNPDPLTNNSTSGGVDLVSLTNQSRIKVKVVLISNMKSKALHHLLFEILTAKVQQH